MSGGWATIGPDIVGTAQMELDRRMAEATAIDGLYRLRLYHFDPPCLSLGHHQNPDEIDKERCRERGITLAVRPTGGRAVLHKGDRVYSLSAPDTGLKPGAHLHTGIYNLVALALAKGLRSLGVDPDDAARHLDVGADVDLPKLCFSSTTRHEITIGGKKLVGSAQRLLRNSVLQHGSLLITREHLEVVELLAGLEKKRRERTMAALEARTTCLEELGLQVEDGILVETFFRAFDEVFGPLNLVSNEEFESNLQLSLEG